MGLQLACTACFVSPGINSFLQYRAFSHLEFMLDAFRQNGMSERYNPNRLYCG